MKKIFSQRTDSCGIISDHEQVTKVYKEYLGEGKNFIAIIKITNQGSLRRESSQLGAPVVGSALSLCDEAFSGGVDLGPMTRSNGCALIEREIAAAW